MAADYTIVIALLLTILLPLLSCINCMIVRFTRHFWIPVGIVAFSSITACILLFNYTTPLHYSWEWFTTSAHQVNGVISINLVTVVMLMVVSVVSALVHLYSLGYLSHDPGLNRYLAMLGFFTFSMQALLVSGNLLQLFVFWELVGFSSYLLIGFWREKSAAALASSKAFLMNRLGDLGFIIGLLICWTQAGTLEIQHIVLDETWATIAGLCILLGVISKSAQFPLFSWLADAMEGPTPVSALLHAATMVAAGVYVLIQVFPLFTVTTLDIMLVIGMATALLGALAALSQHDIKKILAYSTVSQLGLMIAGIGCRAPEASFLHLFTHAFFKAGLFLAAGSVIHATHQQVLDRLGGLRKKLPITFFTMCITGASLAGLPFLSGFLSKEALLSAAWQLAMINSGIFWIVPILFLTISLITALYVFRMIWFIFYGNTMNNEPIVEAPKIMTIPMMLFAATSVFIIVSSNPISSSSWISLSIPPTELLPMTFAILSSTGGILIGWIIYRGKTYPPVPLNIFAEAFYIDKIYTRYATPFSLRMATVLSVIDRKSIDRMIHGVVIAQVALAHGLAWIDRTMVDGSVNGIARLAGIVGNFARSIQGGKIQQYLVWTILGIVLIIIFTLL